MEINICMTVSMLFTDSSSHKQVRVDALCNTKFVMRAWAVYLLKNDNQDLITTRRINIECP
eukprot:946223-Amphidinium_carterae.1